MRFSDGDVERALILLPDDRLFRPGEIYAVAEQLGFRPADGQGLWYRLLQRGWIVRTGVPIGAWPRRFYWQKTPHVSA